MIFATFCFNEEAFCVCITGIQVSNVLHVVIFSIIVIYAVFSRFPFIVSYLIATLRGIG